MNWEWLIVNVDCGRGNECGKDNVLPFSLTPQLANKTYLTAEGAENAEEMPEKPPRPLRSPRLEKTKKEIASLISLKQA